jgi:hypothetical protein
MHFYKRKKKDKLKLICLRYSHNLPCCGIRQLVPGTPGNVSTTLQQIQARNQQTIDIKSEGNMGVPQRSLPMDPSSLYGQGIIQPKPGLSGAGLNQGVSGLPLKGWPLTVRSAAAATKKPYTPMSLFGI